MAHHTVGVFGETLEQDAERNSGGTSRPETAHAAIVLQVPVRGLDSGADLVGGLEFQRLLLEATVSHGHVFGREPQDAVGDLLHGATSGF